MLPNPKKSKKARVAPCGFAHDMDPFFIGLAAAEFMPADPAAWFDAACAARMSFARSGDKILFGRDQDKDATRDFLKGLLIGTLGGDQALSEWMRARRFDAIENGARRGASI